MDKVVTNTEFAQKSTTLDDFFPFFMVECIVFVSKIERNYEEHSPEEGQLGDL